MNPRGAIWLGWLLAGTGLLAAPVNDLCTGALPLVDGIPFSMSTTDATSTGDPQPGCVGGAVGKGVWFTFSPSISGAVTVSLCGSSFDTVLSIYTGSCDSLVPLPGGCVDDSAECGPQSTVTFLGSAGTVYWVFAAGYGGASGNLNVLAEVSPVKITLQPAGGMVDAGEPFTFSVQAVGSPTPAYQWWKDNAPIPAATLSWYACTNIAPPAQGNYSVVVTSGSMSETSVVAMLKVLPALDLALDTPGTFWTTGGGLDGWYRQTDLWHDGLDSARCGPSEALSHPWMEATFMGPATMTFWWRFPSGSPGTEYLSLQVNDQEQAQLAAALDNWYLRTVYLGAGAQTCRWSGVKGPVSSAGPGYVDQVVVSAGASPVQIVMSPLSQDVVAGGTLLLQVQALGTPPFSYQWFYKGQSIPGADGESLLLTNVQPHDAGDYFAVVGNAYGPTVQSASAAITVSTINLSQAVDYPGLPVSSSSWFGQIGVTHDDFDAAQSGEITHNQRCSLQLALEGPADLSFWWRVSSESNYDELIFRMDDVVQGRISGEQPWAQKNVSIPSGMHTFDWSYEKDLSLNGGADAGWIDSIQYNGPPFLLVEQSPGTSDVSISWPSFLTGYSLQAAPLLPASGSWVGITNTPVLSGDQWRVLDTANGGKRFYRLVK